MKGILQKINLVKGDFRQDKTKKTWEKVLDKKGRYLVLNLKIKCSSGTYIRAIARDFGKEFGGGILYSLKRLRVGNYSIDKSERI